MSVHDPCYVCGGVGFHVPTCRLPDGLKGTSEPDPKVDPVETAFKTMCRKYQIRWKRPKGRIDFYLPDFGLYVECKQYSSPRLHFQLESVEAGPDNPAMVLVGTSAVEALDRMIYAARVKP